MSDIDKELRQVIKDEFDRSLAGWTFTPAMRKAVLERIASEGEPEATPVSSPLKGLRPAYWFAAAAAAFVLAVNLWPRMATEEPLTTGSGAGVASVAVPEEADSDSAAAAGGGESAGPFRTMTAPPQGRLDALPEVGEANLTAAGAPEGEAQVAASAAPGDEIQAAAASSKGEARGTVTSALKVSLRAEDLPALTDKSRGTWHVYLNLEDKSVALSGQIPPAQDSSVGAMEAASPAPLHVQPLPDGGVVVYGRSSVQVVDAHGNPVSETPIDQPPAAVVYGPAGESAVVTPDAVLRFTAEGRPAGALRVATVPELVAVNGDRTAVADPGGIRVYDADVPVLTLSGLRPSALALAPDGTLGLLTGSPREPRLMLYDAGGQLLLDQPVAPDGEAFGFLADGRQVAVGSTVYDRTGHPVWRFPVAPAWMRTLAGGRGVLAWNLQQAVWVEPDSGAPVWLAEVVDGSILLASGSARGDLTAIVVAAADGPAMWVIDESGRQRHAERLSDWPVDVAVSDDRLLLLTAEGLKVRPLAP